MCNEPGCMCFDEPCQECARLKAEVERYKSDAELYGQARAALDEARADSAALREQLAEARAVIADLTHGRDSTRAKALEEAAQYVMGSDLAEYSSERLAKEIRALLPAKPAPNITDDPTRNIQGSGGGPMPAPVERVECDRCGHKADSSLRDYCCNQCPGVYRSVKP
jgi:hypothetical protein